MPTEFDSFLREYASDDEEIIIIMPTEKDKKAMVDVLKSRGCNNVLFLKRNDIASICDKDRNSILFLVSDHEYRYTCSIWDDIITKQFNVLDLSIDDVMCLRDMTGNQ